MKVSFQLGEAPRVEVIDVNSPVEEVIVRYQAVNQNIIQVQHGKQQVKVLRLLALKEWKAKHRFSSIVGYYKLHENSTTAHVWIPKMGYENLDGMVLEFIRILFHGTHEDKYM